MKICVAQTRPVKGDIPTNIMAHKRLIDLAVLNSADTIIFPELSITGYEPELAKELATDKNDRRLDDFQKISDTKRITIGVGMPLKGDEGIYIGMIIFQPGKERQTYCKQYLHEHEVPFFVNGPRQAPLLNNKISLSICYELSVPAHSADAAASGAAYYISSSAKTAGGMEKAIQSLSAIAGKYSMMVMIANCIGYCDNFEAAGKTSAWNEKGELLGQLDGEKEGIIVLDTVTKEIITSGLPVAR